ncbi:hypothetical protein Tco_0780139 [Tanacetum coccineum]
MLHRLRNGIKNKELQVVVMLSREISGHLQNGSVSTSMALNFGSIVYTHRCCKELFYRAAVQGALADVFVRGNDLVANAHRMAAPEKWLYPEVELINGIQMILETQDLVLLLQPLRHSHLDTFSVEVKKRATLSIYLGIRDSSLTHRLDERSEVAEFSGLQSSRRLIYGKIHCVLLQSLAICPHSLRFAQKGLRFAQDSCVLLKEILRFA